MDDIWYHVDAEADCLQDELISYSASDERAERHVRSLLQALLHLKHTPSIFRPAFAELLNSLPISVQVTHKHTEEKVSATGLEIDFATSRYAHYRCVFEEKEGEICEAWTLIPFATDTYFRGLAGIFALASTTSVTGHALEAGLTSAVRNMFCNRHEDLQKDLQASSVAAASRPVIEQWREREMARFPQTPFTPRDLSSGAEMGAMERLREEVSRLREENHRLQREVHALGSLVRSAGGP